VREAGKPGKCSRTNRWSTRVLIKRPKFIIRSFDVPLVLLFGVSRDAPSLPPRDSNSGVPNR
jgi:hypothetical protein